MAGAAGLRRLTDMKNGAVSVAPSPVSIGTRRPVSCTAMASRLFQTWGDSAAPEKNIACSRLKNFCAQRRVVAQIGQQRFIALGHVEIDRRRDLAQIAHGLLDAARHRLARVEIHRAAIEQRQPDIVIAAEGVVPRQPVDDDRRLVLQEGQRVADHHLVGADHALGVDDRLRIAGRARGQQEFRDGVGADRRSCAASRPGCSGVASRSAEHGHLAARHFAAARPRSRYPPAHWRESASANWRRRRRIPGPASAASSGSRACRNPSTPANRPATPGRTESPA